jgi:hypothetical protein
MEKLHNRTARPDTSLTPEQQATADMLAARMFHDDFHGAPLPDGQDASNDLPSAAATDCR